MVTDNPASSGDDKDQRDFLPMIRIKSLGLRFKEYYKCLVLAILVIIK